MYSVQDATIACTYAQLAATDLGYGCVWVGAFDENSVREILDLDSSLQPVAILPVGVPNEEPERNPRRDYNDIVHTI